MTRVWDDCVDVQGTALLVLLCLADHANDDGLAWPAWQTLVARTRTSESTVYRQLKKLRDLGRLEPVGKSRSGTVVYRLFVDPPAGDRAPRRPSGDGGDPCQDDTPVSLTPPVTGDRSPLSPVGVQPVTGDRGSVMNRQGTVTSRTRERPGEVDALAAALAEVCGLEVPGTRAERSRTRRAARELVAVGADARDVAAAGEAYRRAWPTMALTPTALARHWSRFRPAADEDRARRAAERLAVAWAQFDLATVEARLASEGHAEPVIEAARVAWAAAQP